jgi:regulator of replication initiation timing
MIGIKEIYEIACTIKNVIEENEELKYENQRLRQVEKDYRAFTIRQISQHNEIMSDTLKALIKK